MTSDQHSSSGGIENPAVLDKIIHDLEKDQITLVMIENRPWTGGEGQLFQIQEKINSYLSFALDGELNEAYPNLAGKPIGLQLECFAYPDDQTIGFLDRIQAQLDSQGIPFLLRVIDQGDEPPSPFGRGQKAG